MNIRIIDDKEKLIRQAFKLYEYLSDKFQNKSYPWSIRERYLKIEQVAFKRYQRRVNSK